MYRTTEEVITTASIGLGAKHIDQTTPEEPITASNIKLNQELDKTEGDFETIDASNSDERVEEPYCAEDVTTACDDESNQSQKQTDELSNDNELSRKLKMALKLRTEFGQAIYRLRKCTVEPVIGIIKETIGFRQFSRRGLEATAGEWSLTCLAFNLKHLHKLTEGEWCSSVISPTGC